VSDATHVVFAPDGRSVYFTTATDGPPATYRVSADGGTPTLVSPLFERATPSPDGRFLAGVYRANPKAPITLGVLSAASGQPVTTFTDFSVGPVVGSVMWSVDGKDVLYTTAERFNIWRRPYLGGDPVKVTNFTDLTIVRFAPSPDGRWFVLCRGATLRDAYLLTGF
jgi:Tol biopolymer transport system component